MSDHDSQAVSYLQSLAAIRDRTSQVFALAQNDQLLHFSLDMAKLDSVVNYVDEIIKRDYKSILDVPGHSRWRHFECGDKERISKLIAKWASAGHDDVEITRRIIDLFVISVLLDAGAGDNWSYKSEGKLYNRSEGLAIASYDMFLAGAFSTDANDLARADADSLLLIGATTMEHHFQVSSGNSLVGLEGRTLLLNRLGAAMKDKPQYFKYNECFRPGNIVDYLMQHQSTIATGSGFKVQMETVWTLIIDGFGKVWPPSRTHIGSVSVGDVWPCEAILRNGASAYSHLVPFHKLSQWLTYSLMEPMATLLNMEFENANLMTGLAEYRNGGLLVDFGLITLKQNSYDRGIDFAKLEYPERQPSTLVPLFTVDDQVIVEWRALTVAILDIIGDKIRDIYQLGINQLPLVKVLEGGTWKAGREIAAKKRPRTKGPPIQIKSDGTVF